ncbi:MAG: alpha/beta fold hydrolase [Alphaproteobacteria bacterium]
MQSFTAKNTQFYYTALGHSISEAPETARDEQNESEKESQSKSAHHPRPLIIWGHGWGQSGKAFEALAQSLQALGAHCLLDFPGFGASPKPQDDWSTKDYADAIADHLKQSRLIDRHGKIIWIGHSFGGRVGLQLASHHPDLVGQLIIIAGAGLQRKHSLLQKLKRKTRALIYQSLKKLALLGLLDQDKLFRCYASRDYQNAGEMREIFRNVIREDLTAQAQNISAPTLLIYGENDSETPPEFGERFHRLIKNSQLHILHGQDHYSVLSSGRHQVAGLIDDFVKEHTKP